MLTQEQHLALREKYNPDGSPRRELQMRLLDTLLWFDGFCKEHGIKYWLSSGTCLGAVRHHGFIPWDDDVDVDMMQEDFEKLVACFKENEDYALQTPENDFFYLQGFAKFRDKHSLVAEHGEEDERYKYRGLYIDIFTMGHNRLPYFIYQRVKQHTCWITALSIKRKFTSFDRALYSLLKKIHFKFINLCWKKDNEKKGDTLRYSAGNCFYKFVFKAVNVAETVDMDFEGHQLPVPKGWDGYLSDMFGDYMKVPDESEREAPGHFIDWKLLD
ncbi:MAG: LicD family protein [Bacteroidales bacterium]|nr:LicD family protein [Bacteroidales bacterium]